MSDAEGCSTWVHKWDRHEFVEGEAILGKHNHHSYEGKVASTHEDVIQVILGTHLRTTTNNLFYIRSMLCNMFIE